MKTPFIFKVFLGAVITAIVSCATTPLKAHATPPADLSRNAPLSQRVYAEVNTYRQNRGLSMIERHSGLDRLAQKHSEYLLQHQGEFGIYGKNVSHYGFEGRAHEAQIRYDMLSVSENVASSLNSSANSAPIILQLWSKSKDHEFNMRGAWTHTGVGTAVSNDGTVFATQLFATVSESQMLNRDRFNRH